MNLKSGRKINNIAFVCHPLKEALPPLLHGIVKWALKHKINARVSPKMGSLLNMPELVFDDNFLKNEAELMVVLGGDGTILSAARDYAEYDLPIAGINMGHLGFMTLESNKNAIHILMQLTTGHFNVEERAMLRANVYRDNEVVYSDIALNDAVIQKAPLYRIIKVNVSISGTFINSYEGDGLIISTPTGSTAYSLAAGGPIIPPWVNVMLVCPLNNHTLSARPVVVSDNEHLECRLGCLHSTVQLVLDGHSEFKLQSHDLIEVTRAKEVAKVVTFEEKGFFNVLRRKMNWG